MENLVVFDITTDTVYIYHSKKFEGDMEDILNNLGHNINNCFYQVCNNVNVVIKDV